MNLDPNENKYVARLKDVMEEYLVSFGGRNLYEDFVKRLKLTDSEEEVLKKHFFNPLDLDYSQFTKTDKTHLKELIFKYYRKDKEGDLEGIKQTDRAYQINPTSTNMDLDQNESLCAERLKNLIDACMDQPGDYDNYLNLVDKLKLTEEEEKVLSDHFLLSDEVDYNSIDNETALGRILESYHEFECKVVESTNSSDFPFKAELKLLKQVMYTEAEIIDFMSYLKPKQI
ncbi:hypothetical protein HOA91_02650 [Candidatus Woesearchaeota archaeon]|jgi:hypothetical protein|nr:hypothetical protein [Candidatus Woesearchaeota archaeon]